MSFDIICPNCGAASSPVVGVCPFCKAVMTTEEDKQNPTIARIRTLYSQGQMEQALALASDLEEHKADALKSANFALLYAQILIEVDAPSGKVKSVLLRSMNDNPSNPVLTEYLEIMEARTYLSHERDDAGEVALASIIRRSPENVYALFLLGSHLFWVENDTQRSLRYLEQCVKLRPNFIRAKACLAAVYKKLKMHDAAARLLHDCAAKVSDTGTKEFFQSYAKAE
jgi:predicted Zn-dependent protease